jgi:hypothetical protein
VVAVGVRPEHGSTTVSPVPSTTKVPSSRPKYVLLESSVSITPMLGRPVAHRLELDAGLKSAITLSVKNGLL